MVIRKRSLLSEISGLCFDSDPSRHRLTGSRIRLEREAYE